MGPQGLDSYDQLAGTACVGTVFGVLVPAHSLGPKAGSSRKDANSSSADAALPGPRELPALWGWNGSQMERAGTSRFHEAVQSRDPNGLPCLLSLWGKSSQPLVDLPTAQVC